MGVSWKECEIISTFTYFTDDPHNAHIDKLISLVVVGYRLEPILQKKNIFSFFPTTNKQASKTPL